MLWPKFVVGATTVKIKRLLSPSSTWNCDSGTHTFLMHYVIEGCWAVNDKRFVVENGRQKRHFLQWDWTLCFNISTILGAVFSTIKGPMWSLTPSTKCSRCVCIYILKKLASNNFHISTLFLKLTWNYAWSAMPTRWDKFWIDPLIKIVRWMRLLWSLSLKRTRILEVVYMWLGVSPGTDTEKTCV